MAVRVSPTVRKEAVLEYDLDHRRVLDFLTEGVLDLVGKSDNDSMHVSQSDTTTSYETVRAEVTTALADVRGCTREELEGEAAASGGNLEMDSKEAEVVIARVEAVLDVGTLARAADLEPEQLSGLDSLSHLLHGRIPSGT